MSILEVEGHTFSTSGEYRIEKFRGDFFVIGNGFCCPCESEEDANGILEKVRGEEHDDDRRT